MTERNETQTEQGTKSAAEGAFVDVTNYFGGTGYAGGSLTSEAELIASNLRAVTFTDDEVHAVSGRRCLRLADVLDRLVSENERLRAEVEDVRFRLACELRRRTRAVRNRERENEIEYVGLTGYEADRYRDKRHQVVRALRIERDELRESLATAQKERDEAREEVGRLFGIVMSEHEHGIECTECGNANALVRSVCGRCGATLLHTMLADQLREAQRNMHPWYGPCDGLREDGSCSECRRNNLSRYKNGMLG